MNSQDGGCVLRGTASCASRAAANDGESRDPYKPRDASPAIEVGPAQLLAARPLGPRRVTSMCETNVTTGTSAAVYRRSDNSPSCDGFSPSRIGGET